MAEFRTALDDRRYHNAIVAEASAAEALGVDGTPTLFVNGLPLVGSRDASALDQVIDSSSATRSRSSRRAWRRASSIR